MKEVKLTEPAVYMLYDFKDNVLYSAEKIAHFITAIGESRVRGLYDKTKLSNSFINLRYGRYVLSTKYMSDSEISDVNKKIDMRYGYKHTTYILAGHLPSGTWNVFGSLQSCAEYIGTQSARVLAVMRGRQKSNVLCQHVLVGTNDPAEIIGKVKPNYMIRYVNLSRGFNRNAGKVTIVNGEYEITLKDLKTVAKTFGVDAGYLSAARRWNKEVVKRLLQGWEFKDTNNAAEAVSKELSWSCTKAMVVNYNKL